VQQGNFAMLRNLVLSEIITQVTLLLQLIENNLCTKAELSAPKRLKRGCNDCFYTIIAVQSLSYRELERVYMGYLHIMSAPLWCMMYRRQIQINH